MKWVTESGIRRSTSIADGWNAPAATVPLTLGQKAFLLWRCVPLLRFTAIVAVYYFKVAPLFNQTPPPGLLGVVLVAMLVLAWDMQKYATRSAAWRRAGARRCAGAHVDFPHATRTVQDDGEGRSKCWDGPE